MLLLASLALMLNRIITEILAVQPEMMMITTTTSKLQYKRAASSRRRTTCES
jgi:hypothetical protein